MIEIPFFTGIWISFFIVFLSSFFVFFASSFKMLVMASALNLTGISVQILNTDSFRSTNFGQTIVISLCFLFAFQSISFIYFFKTKPQKNFLFFALPFLSFITIAISLDLITLLFGLVLFGISFTQLKCLKDNQNKKILSVFQKLFVSFLCFGYGLACLYTREGTIILKDLYLKLSKGTWDSLTSLGVSLMVLSVLIELYAVIPVIGKKK